MEAFLDFFRRCISTVKGVKPGFRWRRKHKRMHQRNQSASNRDDPNENEIRTQTQLQVNKLSEVFRREVICMQCFCKAKHIHVC